MTEPRKAGRPRTAPSGERRDHVLRVPLTPSEMAALREQATREGVAVAELVRRALERRKSR